MREELIKFKEVQKFTQWWLWLILIGVGGSPVFLTLRSYIVNENITLPIGKLIITSTICLGLILFFVLLKLTTIITSENVLIHFYPFVKKKIEWTDIKSAKIIKYDFVGGWGIRLLTKYGTVYNIKGNIGLKLELKNGKEYLIGTQQQADLEVFLKHINRINKETLSTM